MNTDTRIQIDFELQNFKMFLLKDCPIDELDDHRPNFESNNIRDIVIGYRLNDISLLDALSAFLNPDWKDQFDYLVLQNMVLNQIMLIDEMEEK
jgi:hypothetical protein